MNQNINVKLKVIFSLNKMSEQEQHKYVNYISIPSHIPKVSYRYMPCGKSNKNRRLLVKYHSSDKELYLDDITKLKNDIINTKERYVYPTVFVNFALCLIIINYLNYEFGQIN